MFFESSIGTSCIGHHILPETLLMRIVQISDVHLDLIGGKSRLKRVLRQVRGCPPDIFVSTGDLVDGRKDNMETLTDMFQSIPTKYRLLLDCGRGGVHINLRIKCCCAFRAYTVAEPSSRFFCDIWLYWLPGFFIIGIWIWYSDFFATRTNRQEGFYLVNPLQRLCQAPGIKY